MTGDYIPTIAFPWSKSKPTGLSGGTGRNNIGLVYISGALESEFHSKISHTAGSSSRNC